MYYKATLTDNGEFRVEKISDEDALGFTSGIYGYTHGKESGTFAVRKSKKSATNALWKILQEEIAEHEAKLVELIKLQHIIKN